MAFFRCNIIKESTCKFQLLSLWKNKEVTRFITVVIVPKYIGKSGNYISHWIIQDLPVRIYKVWNWRLHDYHWKEHDEVVSLVNNCTDTVLCRRTIVTANIRVKYVCHVKRFVMLMTVLWTVNITYYSFNIFKGVKHMITFLTVLNNECCLFCTFTALLHHEWEKMYRHVF